MKLRGKLIISYILLISMVFLIFYIIAMPLVRNYIKNQVSAGLEQEQVLVKSYLDENMDDITDRETYLKAFARERIAIERFGLSSSIGIFYYARVTGTLTFVQDIEIDNETSDNLIARIIDKDTSSFIGTLNGENHVLLAFPLSSAQAQQRLFILMYTPETAIIAFTKGFTRILILVFGFTTVLAIIISLVLAEKMTNPIEKLKQQALLLRKRDFTAKSSITANDEFRELSVALNQAAAELEIHNTAQKDFLDNVSHELRTPLMSIQGYAEGIRDGIFKPDEKTLGIIVGESIRLKNLVGNISYLSKLESTPDFYKFSEVNAGDVLRGAIAAVSGLEQAREIGLVVLAAPDALMYGDGEKLTQLFINILSNALRYAVSSVIIEAIVENNFYSVKIKDDGPGLPVDDTDKVFRRFYKGERGNTGLGLSISLAIARRHQGNITAQNITPTGALFTVLLPLNSQ
ncbi:MAG: HAMP domain-containing histidine kinase [Clostridia bacterium]|nr:HAMP domain-containing histidine kinase [Clostridia bacterium]MBN2883389.1 HAMP domain-containing histidine kinase [Clostridia bacterium]